MKEKKRERKIAMLSALIFKKVYSFSLSIRQDKIRGGGELPQITAALSLVSKGLWEYDMQTNQKNQLFPFITSIVPTLVVSLGWRLKSVQ